MWFIDFLIAVLAPILVPFLDFGLSKICFTSRVTGPDEDSCKKVETLSVFLKGLPSAFVGNAIWGFTYHIQNYTKETVIWMGSYFFICMFSVSFLVFSYIKNINIKIYKWFLFGFSLVLIILTIIRIAIS